MLRWLLAAVVVWSMGVGAPYALGQGGPPLITDDPGTPGAGRWEINVAYTLEKSRDAISHNVPLGDFNYGVGEHIQLKYQVPLLITREHGETSVDAGGSQFGIKYRFLDEDRSGVSASVYPQIQFNDLTFSRNQNGGDSGTSVFLPFELSRSFGKLEADIEAGYDFIQHDRDRWMCGLVFAYPVTSKLELLAELHEEADQSFRTNDELLFNLGGRYAINDNVALLFSAGRSFYNRVDNPQFLLFAGVSFTF